ncbi:LrgB family protein [Nocardioides sp. R-C-SC26]|uniref:LrgB family protein n=1 Tax=Nocardioides sp. R-C-SC26 TaxID=2870414 RepID=UPI001E5DA15F|nr:LrgB family protein [Nocardioides sp. R-C-SC26]
MSDVVEWARTSPLVFIAATLAAYQGGCWLRTRTGGHPLAQPAVIGIVVVGALVVLVDVDYAAYRSGVEVIAFWLGPATVALAVPLHRHLHRLQGLVLPMLLALVAGAAVSITTGVLLARWLGGSDVIERTVAPKAATTPVAIALADDLGGIGPLASVFAILVGILGAILGPWLFRALRIRDPRTRGLAMGAVSHGIGTSRLLHDDEQAGAFAGLSMGLTALATALLLPLLAFLLF